MVSCFKNRYSFVHIVSLLIIFIFYQLAGKVFTFYFQDSYKLMEIILKILSSYFLVLLLLLYIVFLMKKSSVEIKKELNISIKKLDILWGVIAYLISFLILFMLDYFLPINSDESRFALKINYLITNSHYFVFFILFIYGSFLGPVTEELVFRGFIWRIFEEKRFNRFLILFGTSLLFALFHFELSMFPSLFTLGIIFGFLRMRTNRLGTSIIMHVLSNTFAILLTAAFYLFYS